MIWAHEMTQQSFYLPTGYIGPDEANMSVVPRRGMHLPADGNPFSRGTKAQDPETEEVWHIQ